MIDVRNPVTAVRTLRPLSKYLSGAADLLNRIVDQDIHESDGQMKMRKSVAEARMTSVTDPDSAMGAMVVGHSKRFQGGDVHRWKLCVSIVATAANKPDAEPLLEVLEQSGSRGVKTRQTTADSAQCDWLLKESLVQEGIEIIAEPSPKARVEGR